MLSAIFGGISLALGIASAGVSAGASAKAAEEQRKKQGILDAQEAEDKALFEKQYYQDITKRTEIQNMLRILDENQRKADARSDAQAAIMGATPEQQLAAKEVNRRTYADSLADIASNASQIRDQYLRDYQGQRNKHYAQRLGMQDVLSGIYSNQANQWATAANGAFAAGGQMLGSSEALSFNPKTQKSNKKGS